MRTYNAHTLLKILLLNILTYMFASTLRNRNKVSAEMQIPVKLPTEPGVLSELTGHGGLRNAGLIARQPGG